MKRSIINVGMIPAVLFVACLLGGANSASAGGPKKPAAEKKPAISANPAVVVVEPGKSGSTTLVYEAGKKHPYVEVWVSVNGGNLKKVLEDDGDGKGTRMVTVVGGMKYRFVLTDFGKELASVNVTTKRASAPTPVPVPTPNPNQPAPVPPTPQPPAPAPGETKRSSILGLTNAFRAKNGVAAVKLSSVLNSVAERYAKVMAEKDKLGHSVDGTKAEDRIKAAGYTFVAWAENVAVTSDKTDPNLAAFELWKNSTTGHRENMLNAGFTEMGIGSSGITTSGRIYYCQIFAKPK